MLLKTIKQLLMPHSAVSASLPPASHADHLRKLMKEKSFNEVREQIGRLREEGKADLNLLAVLAEAEFHLGNDHAAAALSSEVLKAQPNNAHAHYVISMLHHEAKELEEALLHAHFAERLDATPEVIAHLGLCLLSLGKLLQARDVLQRAILFAPDNAKLLVNLGITHALVNDKEKAERFFLRALEIEPTNASAKNNLDTLYEAFAKSEGQAEVNTTSSFLGSDEGIAAPSSHQDSLIDELENQLLEAPDDINAAIDLANKYLSDSKFQEAQDVLTIAINNSEQNPRPYTLMAKLKRRMGSIDEAQSYIERAYEIDPDDVDTLLSMADLKTAREDYEGALALYKTIVAKDERPSLRMKLAIAQTNACLYQEALATCDDVIEHHPEFASFMDGTRGVSLAYLGQFEAAKQLFDKVLARDPNNTGLRFYRAMINLLTENYAEGWQDYKYRFMDEPNHIRLLPFPSWKGEPLAGKTILILAEQGLGDQVMFASCLTDLAALAPKKIVLEAHERVAKTLRRSFPDIEVFSSTQKRLFEWLPKNLEPDFYAPIGALPGHFRNSIERFPSHAGYLRPSPERVEFWKRELANISGKPKVGISWRGGTQKTRSSVRSMTLPDLSPVLSNPNFHFVNLQYGDVAAELEAFNVRSGIDITHFPEAIQDLDEFAALISALDLVITVCNTTVHFSGALDKEVWVMAPTIPEWRYGYSTRHMRWYPSARLYRQPATGGWKEVISDIASDLAR